MLLSSVIRFTFGHLLRANANIQKCFNSIMVALIRAASNLICILFKLDTEPMRAPYTCLFSPRFATLVYATIIGQLSGSIIQHTSVYAGVSVNDVRRMQHILSSKHAHPNCELQMQLFSIFN